MKKLIVSAFVLAFSIAYAVEPVVCTLAVSDGGVSYTSDASVDGGQALSDGGTLFALPCPWPAGSTVLMQCNVNVYAQSTTFYGYRTVAPATTGSQYVQFSANSDPYIFYLDPNDQVISLVGESSGNCKFMTSKRRKPY